MFEELVKFWKDNLDLKSGNYFAAADKQLLEENANLVPPQSFASFIKSKDYAEKNSQKVHVGLLPRPYSGDIENARIYFLMINPGFGPWDYFAEENPEYRKDAIQTLKQQRLDLQYPFSQLNPKFSWTGGGRYWNKKLAPLIKHIQIENEVSYQEAASWVSKQFAVLELFPYHSQTFGISNKLLNKLPSSQVIKRCVQELAIKHPDRLIIVARKVKMWGINENDNVLLFNNIEARGAHLRKKMETIQEYLK